MPLFFVGGMTQIYLPCSLSARLWTGAHCLSGSAVGKVLCPKTERNYIHLDTERVATREAETVKTMTQTLKHWRTGSRLA